MSDTVKPLSLSQAIRLGAMLTKQGKGGWMDREERCALSAAADACGIPARTTFDYAANRGRTGVPYEALAERFPIAGLIVDGPPNTSIYIERRRLLEVVYRLNDGADWTREQIADWVEQIEQQHGATVPILDHVQVEVTA